MGKRPPSWIQDGYRDYAGRLPRAWRLELHEIPLAKDAGGGPAQRRDQEGERLLAAAREARLVALDRHGRAWSTEQLAQHLQRWASDGRDVALLIGGPEGLSDAVLARAETRWSLSTLTFPHTLARVIVAEQFYRAWSLLSKHPYHRA